MYSHILRPSAVQSIAKYDPSQQRVPKGSPHGGEFAKATGVAHTPTPEGEAFAKFLEKRQAERHAMYEAKKPQTWARLSEVTQVKGALEQYAKTNNPQAWENAKNQAWESVGKATPVGLASLEVRKAMKQRIKLDLMERLRKYPAFTDMNPRQLDEFVQARIDGWADTAGDSDVAAVKMQHAVQQEFGLDSAETSHMDEVAYVVNEQERRRDRIFVRVEYERTQEWFKARGITHVSVFRGMGFDADVVEPLGAGHETVTMQPASSWTTDLETAIEFANNQDVPFVLTSRVPVSEVLSTCVTGRGCLAEEEFILLGRPQRAQVFDGSSYDPESHAPFTVWMQDRVQRTLLS